MLKKMVSTSGSSADDEVSISLFQILIKTSNAIQDLILW